jgi:hypothetical protein
MTQEERVVEDIAQMGFSKNAVRAAIEHMKSHGYVVDVEAIVDLLTWSDDEQQQQPPPPPPPPSGGMYYH